MATIDVKDATGSTVAIEMPLAPSRAMAALSRPVVLSTEDFAKLDEILTKLSADPATETTIAAVLAKLIAAPATEATIAAVLAKLIAAPATEAKQDTLLAAVATAVNQQATIDLLAAAIADAIHTRSMLVDEDDAPLATSVTTWDDGLQPSTAAIGGTKDNGPHWTSLCGVAGVAFSSADAQTAAAVTDAPTAGQKLCIDDVIVSVGATAMAVSLIEETSNALMFPVLYMLANSTAQLTLRGKRKLLVADKKLMVDASAAGNVSILTTYHSEP